MRKILIAIIFIAMFSSFNSLSAQETPSAPAFLLRDTRNNTVSLSDYKDKEVLLFFWTTWCPFCRKELALLNDKHAQLKSRNTELLAINVGEDIGKVERFIEARNLTYPILLDKDGAVTDAYQVLGVPTYILINKEGKIISRGHSFPQER